MRTHSTARAWFVAPVLATSLAMLVSACGGLENEPFKVGTVKGQISDADQSALVSVVGREDLVARPDTQGFFVLQNVPLGRVELLVVHNRTQLERVSVDVAGASSVDLGPVAPQPGVHTELYVQAPGGQYLAGTVQFVGTPLAATIRPPEFEAELHLPPGCYTARAVVAGLGTQTDEFCISAGAFAVTRRLTMPVPDGSAGNEGCPVSGCQAGLVCQADLACR